MRSVLRIIIAVVIVLAGYALIRLLPRPDSGPQSVLEQHTVRRGAIEQLVAGTGELKSVTFAEIVSKLEGTLGQPLVKEGQQVTKDQLLIRITNDEITTTLKLKRAELAGLNETLKENKKPIDERTEIRTANAAYQRLKDEHKRKARDLAFEEDLRAEGDSDLPDEDFEDLKTAVELAKEDADVSKVKYDSKRATAGAELDKAEANVAMAEAEIEKLEEQEAGREVLSPIKGTVLKVMVKPEELAVEPDKEYAKDTPLFFVADLESILVLGRIYQSDAAKLDRKRIDGPDLDEAGPITARVRFIGEGRQLDGTLTYLALRPDESSSGVGQYEVKIEFAAPPENVRDGLQVHFDLIVRSLSDVVVVPVRFVEFQKKKATVRKVGESGPVEVQLGVSDNNFYEVRGGLNEGDVIEWERTSR